MARHESLSADALPRAPRNHGVLFGVSRRLADSIPGGRLSKRGLGCQRTRDIPHRTRFERAAYPRAAACDAPELRGVPSPERIGRRQLAWRSRQCGSAIRRARSGTAAPIHLGLAGVGDLERDRQRRPAARSDHAALEDVQARSPRRRVLRSDAPAMTPS